MENSRFVTAFLGRATPVIVYMYTCLGLPKVC
jgi:hypothetical protein